MYIYIYIDVPAHRYRGTTAGNSISPIALPSGDDVWMDTFAQKKLIFGNARVAVGGRTPGYGVATGGPAASKGKKREEDDVEPVFYHSKPGDLFEEMVHMLGGPKKIGRVYDLTIGDGSNALYAIIHRIRSQGGGDEGRSR